MTPKKSRLHSIWHQWMNKWSQAGARHEYSLYAFKDLLPLLEYGHHRLRQAFHGELPQTHQQCSHTPLEEIPEINELRCIMGINVVECTLLQTLKEVFEQSAKQSPEVSPDDVYQLMAQTCAWHMFTKYCEDRNSDFLMDYREGWLRDKSDEMFWKRTYELMAMPGEPDEDVPDN